jgi:hypothetical protein
LSCSEEEIDDYGTPKRIIAHNPYDFGRTEPAWSSIDFGGSNIQISYHDELPTLNDELNDEQQNNQSEGQTGNNQDQVVETVQQLVNDELFNEIIRREKQKEKTSLNDADASFYDSSDGSTLQINDEQIFRRMQPVNIPTQDVGEEEEDGEEKQNQGESMTSANSQNLAYSYNRFVPSYQSPPPQAYSNFLGKSFQG